MQKKGFTLVEIMIAVAVIGLLAGVAVPNFVKARKTAAENICAANLRKIDEAKTVWALYEGGTSTDEPSWDDLVPDYLKKTPACPLGGSYSPGAVDEYTVCAKHGDTIDASPEENVAGTGDHSGEER